MPRLGDIAATLGLDIDGDPAIDVCGVATLSSAGPGHLAFLANPRYRLQLRKCAAAALIIHPDERAGWSGAALLSPNPYADFARAAALFSSEPDWPAGRHRSAVIADDAVIDPGAHIGAHVSIGARSRVEHGAVIGPGCVIGEDCVVGRDSRLVSRVSLVCRVRIGARVREDDAATAWLARVEACEDWEDEGPGKQLCAPDVHIDAIAPAPDGATIAVLMHSFAGEYTDTHPLELIDAARAGFEAHLAQGLARLKAEDFEGAARHFERASVIDTQAWKGPYNLACARARAGQHDAARAALEQAVARGGDAVRAKMKKDRDLDGVRGEAWFDKL